MSLHRDSLIRWMTLKGYANATIKSYVSRVKSFCDWLRRPVKSATASDLSNYLYYLREELGLHIPAKLTPPFPFPLTPQFLSSDPLSCGKHS